MSGFSVENFLSHSAKIFIGHALGCLCFRVSKNVYASEGYDTNFCRIILSENAEKFRTGTLL